MLNLCKNCGSQIGARLVPDADRWPESDLAPFRGSRAIHSRRRPRVVVPVKPLDCDLIGAATAGADVAVCGRGGIEASVGRWIE